VVTFYRDPHGRESPTSQPIVTKALVLAYLAGCAVQQE
jgi:hypothetical protein